MSAAADYPLVRALDALNGGPSALDELDRLRAWKASAMESLAEWHALEALIPDEVKYAHLGELWPSVIGGQLAELAALKARRCDGCVRWGAVYVSGPYAGMASCDGQPVDDCGCGAMPMTAPDHACNAWEARTDG